MLNLNYHNQFLINFVFHLFLLKQLNSIKSIDTLLLEEFGFKAALWAVLKVFVDRTVIENYDNLTGT